jgi:hypothetical protein
MKFASVRTFAPRSTKQQQTAVYIAGFLVLWQVVYAFVEWAWPVHDASPVYPLLALDLLLLLYVGWKWWPLIPLGALLRWGLFDHSGQLWPSLAVQLVVGFVFALAVRFVIERQQVSLPLRCMV